MKSKLLTLFTLFFIFALSSCDLLSFLFLPQDESATLISASYIDETHFRLIGEGGKWNGMINEIPDNINVYIPNKDPNKRVAVMSASNKDCPLNEYIITIGGKSKMEPGDTVKIYGGDYDKIRGAVEFTVPSTNEE